MTNDALLARGDSQEGTQTEGSGTFVGSPSSRSCLGYTKTSLHEVARMSWTDVELEDEEEEDNIAMWKMLSDVAGGLYLTGMI